MKTYSIHGRINARANMVNKAKCYCNPVNGKLTNLFYCSFNEGDRSPKSEVLYMYISKNGQTYYN